jgi:hypothetical protein
MLEDGADGGGPEDDGDDAPGAAAARTVEDVGAERPEEELAPGHRRAGCWRGNTTSSVELETGGEWTSRRRGPRLSRRAAGGLDPIR